MTTDGGPFTRRRLANNIAELQTTLETADFVDNLADLVSGLDAGSVGTSMRLGAKVERATAALPASTTGAIATIATGRVALMAIVGEVTTVIQTQANATKLQFDPTDTGATQDLCATLDITADAVGTMYSITGTPATAMQDSLNFVSSNKMLAAPIILKPGEILLSCAATNTGSVKWTFWYIPLDTGATLTAA